MSFFGVLRVSLLLYFYCIVEVPHGSHQPQTTVNVPQRPILSICTHHDSHHSPHPRDKKQTPLSEGSLNFPKSPHEGDHAACGDIQKKHGEEDPPLPKSCTQAEFFKNNATSPWCDPSRRRAPSFLPNRQLLHGRAP